MLLRIERWEKKEAHTLWGAHLGSLGRAEAAPGEANTWSSLQSKTIVEKEKVEARGLKKAGKERRRGGGTPPSRAWPQTIKGKLVFPSQG